MPDTTVASATTGPGLPAGRLAPRFPGATTGASRLAERERANAAVPVLGTVAARGAGLGPRRWAAGRVPDWQAGLVEDAVAPGPAGLACLPGRNRVPLVAVPG